MSKQDACPQPKQNQDSIYDEKLRKALHSLNQMNASLINMEEKLALQNARCQKVVSDMKLLQKSLVRITPSQSKSS